MDWSPKYKIGNAVIDQQHKDLFGIINTLHEHGNNLDIQKNCILSLQDYAVKHFTTEEEIMRVYGFPQEKLLVHRGEHRAFALKVEEFFWSSNQGKLLLDVSLVYLKGWLTHHVLESDRDLIDYLKNPLKEL